MRPVSSRAMSDALCDRQIDWDESRLNKGHVAVKSGVDSDLDELRRRYHGLSSLLVSFTYL